MVIFKSSTETTQGYTEFTCSRCGNSFKDNYTELTDGATSSHTHSYTSVVTAPTCTERGYTTYTCECGHSYQGDVVEATGDIMEVTVVAPTESTPGYTEHRCIVCGFSYRTDYTELSEDGTTTTHENSYTNSVETPSTCTESGRISNICVCGKIGSYEIIPATGHFYEVAEDTSTCTEAGIQTNICKFSYVIDIIFNGGYFKVFIINDSHFFFGFDVFFRNGVPRFENSNQSIEHFDLLGISSRRFIVVNNRMPCFCRSLIFVRSVSATKLRICNTRSAMAECPWLYMFL